MKPFIRAFSLAAFILLLLCGCDRQAKPQTTEPAVPAAPRPTPVENPTAKPAPAAPVNDHEPLVDESKRREASLSLARGAVYLLSEQRENGSWADHPGITAVCVSALASTEAVQAEEGKTAIGKALAYIRKHITKEGKVKLATAEEDVYSASVCLMALRALNRDEDRERLEAIRNYLVAAQIKGSSEFRYGGGLGYKSYPDLSNTHWALEAIWVTRAPEAEDRRQKLWRRSAAFITSCQVTDERDPKRRGGFLYYPVGKEPEKPAHEKTREVWGSLTMGALKSLFFAGVHPEDPRIKLGLTWLANNYDLTRNPGLQQGGLYYYYYMLSSGLFFLKQDYVVTNTDRKYNWRRDLIAELLTRQRGEGEWRNSNRLWLESNPPLCTAYAMKAMQFALRE